MNTETKIRVQVWVSGDASPTVSLDSQVAFDSEPQIGDIISLGDRGFEMTHKEFERESQQFIGYAVFRHDVGLAEDALQVSETIGRELNIPS